MQHYAPTLQDLAPRDMIARAMSREIREGRGIDGQDYLYLDLSHLGRELIETRLPDIAGFVRTYLGIDAVRAPIPVQPTAHYMMGGIPTGLDARVLIDESGNPLPGLYAAGECACVSVHGANRLGTNSLVDILVFGRRAARDAARFIAESDWAVLPPRAEQQAQELVRQIRSANGEERPARLLDELQDTMMQNVAIFRTAKGLEAARDKITELHDRYRRIRLDDCGIEYNMDLLQAIEVRNLLDLAQVIVAGALAREESRGAHYREDFPERDDTHWLKHTLAWWRPEGIELKYKPVTITMFQPQERKY